MKRELIFFYPVFLFSKCGAQCAMCRAALESEGNSVQAGGE
jgi:hypothetical protein